jgi:hypothetical protein
MNSGFGGGCTRFDRMMSAIAMLQEPSLDSGRCMLSNMEPAERLARRVVIFTLMIFAFLVAEVFGEASWHMGWQGLLIGVAGATIAAFAGYLWKRLRD